MDTSEVSEVDITAEVKDITMGRVVFKGRAYPDSYLHILKNDTQIALRDIDSSFEEGVKVESGTSYDFSIRAVSEAGRNSVTLTFENIDVFEGEEKTISGIFFPPTIELGATEVEKGEDLKIFGEAFPESEIQIVDSTIQTGRTTDTDESGNWLYLMDTGDLEEGSHWVKARGVKARAVYDGEPSDYSQTIYFEVEVEKEPDPPSRPSQPRETEVRLLGRAYPKSEVTVLVNGTLDGTTTADDEANFLYEITDISGGVYTFGIWAEDGDGRRGRTHSFTANVIENAVTTFDGIFLPPTIDVDRQVVEWGDEVGILGQTTPESTVDLRISSEEEIVEEFRAGEDGTWFYKFDTSQVQEGVHEARARSISPDPEKLLSSFSTPVEFAVGEEFRPEIACVRADINRDGRVDLIDFSILLFNWGPDFVNPRADINQDGMVDIRDFSILLYCWTG